MQGLPADGGTDRRQLAPLISGRGKRQLAVVLVAQCQQIGHRAALNVDLGDGIVLLQRHIGRARVVSDGDVLRLHVLGDAGAGTIDADALRAQLVFFAIEALEIHGANIPVAQLLPFLRIARHRHDAHGTFRIDKTLAVAARLAFVGGQHVAAVGSERDHVGQRADLHGFDQLAVGVVERDVARIGLRIALDGDGDHTVTHGHAVRRAERRGVDRCDFSRTRRISHVENVDRRGLRVHQEQTFGRGIERDDFRRARLASVVSRQRRQLDAAFVLMALAATPVPIAPLPILPTPVMSTMIASACRCGTIEEGNRDGRGHAGTRRSGHESSGFGRDVV